MKNVYIGGVTRAGKTTLTLKLYHELGFSVYEMDTIVHSFTKVFPQLNIDERYPENLDETFKPFAFQVLKCCDKDRKYGKVKMAINGCQLSPKVLDECPVKDNMLIIFLGMSDVSPEYLFSKFKQTQVEGDWTFEKKDETLLKICKNIVEESKIIKQECERYGFMYFDTCLNREDTLNHVLNYIKENAN